MKIDTKENIFSFEFDALANANNYRKALIKEFSKSVYGSVAEIGSGIGQMTKELIKLSDIQKLTCIEPDKSFVSLAKKDIPEINIIEGTSQSLAGCKFDAVVSINVLEHIENDNAELRRYHELLVEKHGYLNLFVPARQEIYAPIDKIFGHFRRYSKSYLRQRLEEGGFEIKKIRYYNFIGYFVWAIIFRLFAQKRFSPLSVSIFDRLIFPIMNLIERSIIDPPIGQSVLVIAQAKG